MAARGVVTAYRFAAAFARGAPVWLSGIIASVAARAVAAASQDRRKLVQRNLERALGRPLAPREARRRVIAVFEWYARYYLESFKLPRLLPEAVDDGFSFQGLDAIERAVRSGIGPILVMPHLGTWEWAAWWLAQVRGMKVTAVVEPLNPPELFEWFTSFRERLGMEIIPIGPDAFGRLAVSVRRGNVVCLLSDRDIGGGGMPVEFFGERTKLPTGPALLALRTGAPLIPAAVYWRGSTRHAIALDPLDTRRRGRLRADVARVVKDYAACLEELIRKEPEQWHLMSPNWPSDYTELRQPMPAWLRDL